MDAPVCKGCSTPCPLELPEGWRADGPMQLLCPVCLRDRDRDRLAWYTQLCAELAALLDGALERGASLKEIAHRAKLAPRTIYRIRAGRALPSADTIACLARVIEIPEALQDELRRAAKIRKFPGLS